MKPTEDIWIDRWSLKTLISSAIEVYPRETMGLLWGTSRQRKFEGKKRKVLSVKSVYPVQTADRKYTKVGWGPDMAKERLLNSVKGLNIGVLGEYNSHTRTPSSAHLSPDDHEYYENEIYFGRNILGKDWIELLIRINEKDNKSNKSSIRSKYTYQKAERFLIDLPPRTYDLTLSGWFIESSDDEISSRKGTVWIDWPIR